MKQLIQKFGFVFLLFPTFTASAANAHPSSSPAESFRKPLALIYKGEGSCSAEAGDAGESGYGCSEASSDVAIAAGFQVRFVGPTDLSDSSTPQEVTAIFGKASVWIQPGGVAVTAFFAMNPRLRTEMVNFVHNGGGYVGFCAGAFMATGAIGGTHYAGFGIFPGSTYPYRYTSARSDLDYGLLPITWNGVHRTVYFEGGPYLYGQGKDAEVMATFDDTGLTAAARAAYGKGRVYLSGAHPEAPPIWSQEDGITDPDGPDQAIAVDMVRWAAGL